MKRTHISSFSTGLTMSNRDEPHFFHSALQFPFSQPLENIEEDVPMYKPLSGYGFPPPETPQEPMEFLSRSWSISALQVAKALDAKRKPVLEEQGGKPHQEVDDSTAGIIPFTYASAMTAQIVMDRILTQQSDVLPSSRRKSLSSGSVNYLGNCPESPTVPGDELMFCRSFSAVRNPLRELSMKRWLKDMKEKRKEANRAQSARIHAAMSVAGVAAAVAAVAAAMATSGADDEQSKTSMAVASAAALVAAQCVEVAESMGALHDQMSSIISSAVSVKTPGDIMTLTAAAATALRGAATLNARVFKDAPSLASFIPHERNSNTIVNFTSESVSEDSETDCRSSDCMLSKGCEFLKRTRKGDMHWRVVFAYLNKESQVVVKSQGKYIGGAITKNKKRLVLDVYNDIPSWPERDILKDGERRWYFGIKTDDGVMELECKNQADHRLWTEGITRLLSLSQVQKQR